MEENKMSNWIPVSSGLFPDDKVEVQVTYIGTNDQKPYCSAFAHRDNGEWHWTEDESDVRVTITAWKEKRSLCRFSKNYARPSKQ